MKFLTIVVWLCCSFLSAAQESVDPSKPTAWPKLSEKDKEELLRCYRSYRSAKEEEVRQKCEKQIAAFGKGGIPVLLLAVTNAKDEHVEPTYRLLNLLVGPEDVDLLLENTKSRKRNLRLYVLRACARLAQPKHSKAFEASLADEDSEIRFWASLAASRAGSVAGLEELKKVVNDRWKNLAAEIQAALEGIRGPEAVKNISRDLYSEELMVQLAAMRLLGCAGDSSAVAMLSPFLDQSDNRLKEGAVNALRGIIDRKPPVENLSVFQLIEEANRWKERLAGGEGKGEKK